MDILRRIGNALSRFMYGRNGIDQLGLCTIWLMIALNGAGIFLSRGLLGALLRLLSTLACVCALYRCFSRDLARRRAENAAFVEKVWHPLLKRLGGTDRRAGDKEHRYFTCDRCRAVCRVPRGKGNIIITCPRCGNQIRAKS